MFLPRGQVLPAGTGIREQVLYCIWKKRRTGYLIRNIILKRRSLEQARRNGHTKSGSNAHEDKRV